MRNVLRKVCLASLVLLVAVGSVMACAAITKKGTVCKRPAQSGSIYCWQHDRMYGNSTPNENSESDEVRAVQCNGITKKGVQCKRYTKSPNGYCWQHGGN